jgi:hypothetical protein
MEIYLYPWMPSQCRPGDVGQEADGENLVKKKHHSYKLPENNSQWNTGGVREPKHSNNESKYIIY